eukprot:CAMPEP_0197018230 /NCGR_PEP_ID=MMETSP1380-20130617/79985_1 /TAXON_ID=5936 /ORGANISM="Euplotes crassus, Strain CT5" /LENGTH=408 /DNA_ID=CAMNT_0042445423 /DNA_START=905 /DNA_END=2128 /DNA_ORIENTATION=+
MNVSPISGEGGFSNPVSESSSSPKKVRKTSIQQIRKQNSNLDNTISRSKQMTQIQHAKHRKKPNTLRKHMSKNYVANEVPNIQESPAFNKRNRNRLLKMKNFNTDMDDTSYNKEGIFGPQHDIHQRKKINQMKPLQTEEGKYNYSESYALGEGEEDEESEISEDDNDFFKLQNTMLNNHGGRTVQQRTVVMNGQGAQKMNKGGKLNRYDKLMYRMDETIQGNQSSDSSNSMNESDGNLRTVNYEMEKPFKKNRYSIQAKTERYTGEETVLPNRSNNMNRLILPSKKLFTKIKSSQLDVRIKNMNNQEVLQTLRVPRNALVYDFMQDERRDEFEKLEDNFAQYNIGITTRNGYLSERKDPSEAEPQRNLYTRYPPTIAMQYYLRYEDEQNEVELWNIENSIIREEEESG